MNSRNIERECDIGLRVQNCLEAGSIEAEACDSGFEIEVNSRSIAQMKAECNLVYSENIALRSAIL